LFGRNKQRRRLSIRRYYVGDYLNASRNPTITNTLAKNGDRNVLFLDEVDKVNKNYKVQRRVLMLSSKGVYNMNPGKFSLNRRIPITAITKISVSKKADNLFVLHIPTEYDYIFICERKTEFLTALHDEYKIETGKNLEITFDNNLTYQLKGKKKATIVFEDGKDAVTTVSQSKTVKDQMVVSCARVEVVASLDKYTPAKMTKGADKPKMGRPHMRGISAVPANVPVASEPMAQQPKKNKPGGTLKVPVQSDSPYYDEPQSMPEMKQTSPAKATSKPVGNTASNQNRTPGLAGPQKTTGGLPVKAPAKAPAKAVAKAPAEVWAKATDDFQPSDERELGFKSGDYMRILAQDANGWWSGEMNGRLGFVPSTYLEICDKPVRKESAYTKAVPSKGKR
jgi:hypothetical protein